MKHQLHRGLVRVIAPAAEPLTLAETKEYLRITHHDDDTRLADMIITVRSLAEQWLKRSLITQSWKLTFEDEISGSVRLPMSPVQSITSITSIALDDTSTTIASIAYALSAAKDAVLLASIITGHRIEITYVAGFGSVSQLPRPIKMGMLAHIAALYDGTASLAPIPDEALHCYTPYRELSL